MKQGEIDNLKVDKLCLKIDSARILMHEVSQMAFDLAKDGDSRLYQLRGAFSGFDTVAKTTAGFLDGLAEIEINKSGKSQMPYKEGGVK